MFDFIIVGAGLSGVTFANILQQHQKSFCLIADNSQVASRIADGVYNPVVLKRFTPIWRSAETMLAAQQFYTQVQNNTHTSFTYPMSVLRKFTSVEEQNNWFTASDKPLLSPYLSTALVSPTNPAVPAPYLLGEVLHTGRMDVNAYLTTCLTRWQAEGFFYPKTFDYQSLQVFNTHVAYQGVEARHIVFCEGCGISKNPFFSTLPMRPCKGETLTFSAPSLQLQHILKSDGSVVPLGGDLYTVGGIYHPEDLEETITHQARLTLIEKLQQMITCPFEIISHQAALRPTVADRRPLVGAHPLHPTLWVLNGLGTRGVLNAPYCAQVLYEAVYEGKPIPPEMCVTRFKKRLSSV